MLGHLGNPKSFLMTGIQSNSLPSLSPSPPPLLVPKAQPRELWHPFHRRSSNTYYVPLAVLSFGNTDESLCSDGALNLVGEDGP